MSDISERGFEPMDLGTVATVALAFLLGGTIKGVTGMGLPTVAVAVMGAALGLREAIPILVLPSLMANAWQAAQPHPIRPLLRRFAVINAASCVGIWIGTMVLFRVDPRLLSALLGVVILAYALMSLSAVEFRVSPPQERVFAAPLGLFSGLLTGSTGSLLLPNIVYLQALHLSRDTFVQATGLTLLVGTALWTAALYNEGAINGSTLLLSAFALVPTLVGMFAGQALRGRISEHRFRTGVHVLLLLLAANLIRKALA